jgi:uncharacterized protein (TIGR03382 family)
VTTPTKPAASAGGCGTPGSPSIALAAVALLALAVVVRRRRPVRRPGPSPRREGDVAARQRHSPRSPGCPGPRGRERAAASTSPSAW